MPKPSPMIETFTGTWEKEWFAYHPGEWPRTTHKVYDPQWAAPEGAKLALEVRCEQPNKLVVGLDDYAAEVALKGGPEWQYVVLSVADFCNAAGEAMEDWTAIRTLRLGPRERLQQPIDGEPIVVELGAEWQGADPAVRNLQWK